jgi:hypothetical protein
LKFSKGEGKAKKKPNMQIYLGRIEVMDSTENMALKSANSKEDSSKQPIKFAKAFIKISSRPNN